MMVGHQLLQLWHPAGRHADDDAALRLTEIEGLTADVADDAGAAQPAATEEGALRQGNEQAAFRNIVGAA